MKKELSSESKQLKPFSSQAEEVFLNIQRTAELLMWGLTELLKPAGITPTQYNVLRILRGAGAEGLTCNEIAARMVTRDPDMTRLLDRLEKQGQVRRTRGEKDRRMVLTFITDKGLQLLEDLNTPIKELHERQLGHFQQQELSSFAEFLELTRKKIS